MVQDDVVVVGIGEIVLFVKKEGSGLGQKVSAFGGQFERAESFDIFIEVTSNNRLAGNGVPEVFVVVFANGKQRKLIVFVGFDIGIDVPR